jgi:[acyl-carrier-protein] S-malonyltransferase
MKPAQERLGEDLERAEIADARVALVNNVEARVVHAACEVRDGLKRQVTAPVRWEQSMRVLVAEKVELFVEVGPGKVLSGLLRQITPPAECLHVEDAASLSATLERLGPGAKLPIDD